MLPSYGGSEAAVDGVETAIATARTIGRLAARPMSDVKISRIANDLRIRKASLSTISAINLTTAKVCCCALQQDWAGDEQ
ncbi:MAG: hypothetical protein ABSA90_05490 [Xanthobacteraceae bacterium]